MTDEHLHSVENSPEMEQAIEEVFDKFQRMTREEFEEALRNAPPSFGRWIVESSKPNDEESESEMREKENRMINEFEKPTKTTSQEYYELYKYAQRMEQTLLHLIETDRVCSDVKFSQGEERSTIPYRGDSRLVCDCLWGLTGEGQGI